MKAPKIFSQTFVAPMGVETFKMICFQTAEGLYTWDNVKQVLLEVWESFLHKGLWKVFSSPSFLLFEMCWWYPD